MLFQEASITEKEWVTKIRQSLKSIHEIDYEKVVYQALWGMKCLIMAKPEHMNKIAHVQTSSVKTGIGNTLGQARCCSNVEKVLAWQSPST